MKRRLPLFALRRAGVMYPQNWRLVKRLGVGWFIVLGYVLSAAAPVLLWLAFNAQAPDVPAVALPWWIILICAIAFGGANQWRCYVNSCYYDES